MKFTNVKVLHVLLLSLLSLSSTLYVQDLLAEYKKTQVEELKKLENAETDDAALGVAIQVLEFITTITQFYSDQPTVEGVLKKAQEQDPGTNLPVVKELAGLAMNYRPDVLPLAFSKSDVGVRGVRAISALAALKYLVENGFDILTLQDNEKLNWSDEQYNYEKLIKDYLTLGKIVLDKDLQVGLDHWLAIVASRGDLAGLNKIWAMTSQQEIDVIPLERKQEILELAIRKGNLEVVTELIGRFGVANNKQLAQVIIDDFPAKREPFIRKAFARVDWGEKAPVAAEKLEELKKYVGMKLQ